VSKADETLSFCDFLKFNIQPPLKVIVVVIQNVDKILYRWFLSCKMSLGWFLEMAYLAAGATITLIPI